MTSPGGGKPDVCVAGQCGYRSAGVGCVSFWYQAFKDSEEQHCSSRLLQSPPTVQVHHPSNHSRMYLETKNALKGVI